MRQIELTRGLVALVDDADYEWLSARTWHASPSRRKWYARSPVPGKPGVNEYMHRVIMGAKPDDYVDHWDDDGLNNQRHNLRLCSNQQNCMNQRKRPGSSRYKGVHWNKKQSVWVAATHFDYGTQFVGNFRDEVEAARAYDEAVRSRFGEFAKTNF